MKDYKFDRKLIGIGGIRCPCCTEGKPRKTKKALNRKKRRANKIDINLNSE